MTRVGEKLYGDRRPAGGRRRSSRLRAPALLAGAVLVGLLAAFVPELTGAAALSGEPIAGCRATDGDTVRCGDERIRLLGIDAPEMPEHCRRGRRCAPGDPQASKAALAAALTGPLTIERVGTDRYGRTLAVMANAVGDLSCQQLGGGYAIYREDWDDGGRMLARCGN